MTDSMPKPVEQPAGGFDLDYSLGVRERARKLLAKPGVTIRPRKDVPLFHVDDNDPGTLVRKLNGKVERGVLENGVFKVTA